MKIVTWNVNSINSRLQHLLGFLKDQSPDVVLLQETKCVNENFPRMEIEEMGYNLAIHGQKSYNGVAILSKHRIEDITIHLPGRDDDEQCRYIEAVIKDFRVASIYVPNGQAIDSDKFQFKMEFFERLKSHFELLLSYNEKLVLGGDYNVAPEGIDVFDPVASNGHICFNPLERAHMRNLQYLGLVDAFRMMHPGTQKFSWWDYRAGAWANNKGLRIDHLLLSPEAADKITACDIDMHPRGLEKASDHAPVWCEVA